MLEDKIVSLLAKSPADQYSLYRQIGDTSMSKLLKAICALQQRKIIRVAKYRKSYRTGLEVPIYSLSENSTANNNNNSSSDRGFKRLDIHNLLVGITSERLVEYEFVARNLVSSKKQAAILDIGSGSSLLAKRLGVRLGACKRPAAAFVHGAASERAPTKIPPITNGQFVLPFLVWLW